jgi:hypothetical protein
MRLKPQTTMCSPIRCALRWRSKLAPKPTRCFRRFHRIADRDQALMNILAGGTFECSDIEAERAGRDPCQHRPGFALWAWWSVKRAHDAVPCIRREHSALSHRWMPFRGGDGESLERPKFPRCSVLLRFTENLAHRKIQLKLRSSFGGPAARSSPHKYPKEHQGERKQTAEDAKPRVFVHL